MYRIDMLNKDTSLSICDGDRNNTDMIGNSIRQMFSHSWSCVLQKLGQPYLYQLNILGIMYI